VEAHAEPTKQLGAIAIIAWLAVAIVGIAIATDIAIAADRAAIR
jgi:hypothetical protein